MDRNQKIAIGCGGVGCLALIAIVIVCGVLLMRGYITMPGSSSNRNENFNANTNAKTNSNSNSNSNLNQNTTINSSTSSSSLSDDDKHKLFQAAGLTKDTDLMLRALRKIGFPNASGAEYQQFTKNHFSWAMKNMEFLQSVNTPEKARAYVNAHLDD